MTVQDENEKAIALLREALERDAGEHPQNTVTIAIERIRLCKEYDDLFGLQHTRDAEAVALWRAEDPEARALVVPDLGNLLEWLIERGNQPLAQINDLAEFIIHEVPGEPSQSEGAIACAIRLLAERNELAMILAKLAESGSHLLDARA